MHHYVFCAATIPANEKSIKLAEGVIDKLKMNWELEADVIFCYYHSSITIIESCGNIEIKFENDNTTQLIDDCMEFARLQEKYKEN